MPACGNRLSVSRERLSAMADKYGLTPQGRTVISNFVSLLEDATFRRLLELAASETYPHSKWAAQSVQDAIEDINAACEAEGGRVGDPEGVFDAAISLAYLVSLARAQVLTVVLNPMPAGMIPDHALVRFCRDAYFANVLKRTVAGRQDKE